MNCCDLYVSRESQEKIRGYVFHMLGDLQVVVELDTEQFNSIFESAISYLAAYMGKDKYAYTVAQTGRNQYQQPADCHTVARVHFDSSYLSVLGNTSTSLFSDFYLLASDLAVDIYESPVTFWAYLASREMLQKVYGVWTDFEIVDGDQIRIYPTPYRPTTIVIYYKSNELDLVSDKYNILRDYVHAKSMIAVGEVREKYSNIQSSGGGNAGLNGTQLKQEGWSLLRETETRAQGVDPLQFTMF